MQLGFSMGLLSVIVGHVLICTPFSIAILNGSFANLDQSLEEASVDLGETQLSTFRLVTLPLVIPGIIAALPVPLTDLTPPTIHVVWTVVEPF